MEQPEGAGGMHQNRKSYMELGMGQGKKEMQYKIAHVVAGSL